MSAGFDPQSSGYNYGKSSSGYQEGGLSGYAGGSKVQGGASLFGSALSGTHHTAAQADPGNEMTYFVFRSLRLRKSMMAVLMTCLLVFALLLERMCFIVTVYKTKFYGYVLILIVIFLNCMFNFAL